MDVKAEESNSERFVLVVDDDDDIRETMSCVLAARGYRVTTVSSGEEALELMRRGRRHPCVVLLDLMMPGVNGFDVRARMIGEPVLADIPVVVFTGQRQGKEEDWSQLQASVLRKPVSLAQLVETVGRYCCPPAATT